MGGHTLQGRRPARLHREAAATTKLAIHDPTIRSALLCCLQELAELLQLVLVIGQEQGCTRQVGQRAS